MAGISSKAAGKLENKKGYNGNELQSKEFSDGSRLEFYNFNARTYDQQIGRFIQIDSLSDIAQQERLSPYHFGENNPVKISDPTGKCGPCIFLLQAIAEAVVAGVTSYLAAKTISDQITPIILQAATDDKKQTGSYTNTHEKGKYHGKGGEERAAQSSKEKEKLYDDPLVNTDWTPSVNDEEAFKAEAKRIRGDGGVKNPDNYNINNSPGEKLLQKEEAANAAKPTVANTAKEVAVNTIVFSTFTILITITKITSFFNK
jgi:RHS repeat-associated protein